MAQKRRHVRDVDLPHTVVSVRTVDTAFTAFQAIAEHVRPRCAGDGGSGWRGCGRQQRRWVRMGAASECGGGGGRARRACRRHQRHRSFGEPCACVVLHVRACAAAARVFSFLFFFFFFSPFQLFSDFEVGGMPLRFLDLASLRQCVRAAGWWLVT